LTAAAYLLVANSRDGATTDPLPLSTAAFEEVTGVEIVQVAVSGGGGILDLRYRVLDPDKATLVHDPDNPPRLIHETTGQVASRPWMQHSRGKELHAAVTYFELLYNPGGVVKRGDAVTVAIGEARLAHVVVQ
jgi:hypothetical protein